MRPNQPPCPECGEDDLDCDEADIGVGIIYGPAHCYACGWSELGTVEERQRDCPEGWYRDAAGNLINKERQRSEVQAGLTRLGIAIDPILFPGEECKRHELCVQRDGHEGDCRCVEPWEPPSF